MVVDSVIGVLTLPPSRDKSFKEADMEFHEDSDDTDSTMEPYDNMVVLIQYQKDIKLEVLTRRDQSKGNSKPKKGRQNPFS